MQNPSKQGDEAVKMNPTTTAKAMSPMQAIRKKCLSCTCNQFNEVKACGIVGCQLWLFRLGLNPNCGDNSKSPFLQPNNFQGRHDMEASDLINLIEKESGLDVK